MWLLLCKKSNLKHGFKLLLMKITFYYHFTAYIDLACCVFDVGIGFFPSLLTIYSLGIGPLIGIVFICMLYFLSNSAPHHINNKLVPVEKI